MKTLLSAALVLAISTASASAKTEPASHHKARHREAAAKDTVPLDEESVHVVRPGETLGGVAARAKVPRILIAEANGLKRPYHVHAGQRLKLPRTRHHRVQPGETGFDIAYRYGEPFSAIAVANGLKPDGKLKTGQDLLIPTLIAPSAPPKTESAGTTETDVKTDKSEAKSDQPAVGHHRFDWPLAGTISRGYHARGDADYHDGIDITAEPGTAVRAAAAGTVIFAGKEPQNFGNLVVIDHGHGWQSAYGFLGRITLHKGDEVHAHERLGTVGHTGKARRDELHFELRKNNKPVDPMDELPEQAKRAAVEPAPGSHHPNHHRKAQKTVPDAR